jgi:hypothetical protein
MRAASTTVVQPAPRSRQALSALAGAGLKALRLHRAYLAIILIYAAACLALGHIAGTGKVVDINLYGGAFVLLIIVFAVVLVLGHASWMAAIVRPRGSLFVAIARDFKTRFVQADRLAGFLAASALAPLFFSSFGSFKRMIPALVPFDWDPAFMQWDRWLHGGEHAWRLLQPVLGTPIVTSAVNFTYNAWFFVLIFTFIWQAARTADPRLRMQFLLSFVLTWILLGTVLATVFASGGPVYYGRLTGLADPYAPLMEYLGAVNRHYPVWSLAVQEKLWATYQAGGTDFGSGISAMPSLHVATSVLFACLGWRIGRVAGIAYSLFALAILIGSVHLGWHYAIDGYFAAIAALAIWWSVGWGLRRAAAARP